MTNSPHSQRIASTVMVALSVLMLVRCVVAWSQLPETVASHFDGAGVPNGFQSRAMFMAIMISVQALLGFAFGVVPRLLRHMPLRMINLPHRDYWLAPEHPERVRQALDRYVTWSMWFGCATFGLMLGIFELAVRANLTHQPMSPLLTWLLIGGYLLGTVIAIIRLHIMLKPPTN